MTTLDIRRVRTPEEARAAADLFLTVAESELGYGFDPGWHWDVDRVTETYLDNPRQAMFIAEEHGAVLGTATVRIGGPKSPPHPQWLADRYTDRAAVAQLMRVTVDPAHRRRGLARRLVVEAQRFVRTEGGYRALCFHTNTRHPAAEPFWRSVGAEVVFDARGTEYDADERFATVHYELPLDRPVPSAGDGFDAAGWFERWERQQEGFVPDREQGFSLSLDLIGRLCGEPPRRILDLAAGPGSFAIRAADRFPGVVVDAVELDPLLVHLGRETHRDRLAWHELDLRDPDWHRVFDDGAFDAVCSATALHYLRLPQMRGVIEGLGRILRPGGVFCELDTLAGEPGHPRLRAAMEGMRTEAWETRFEQGTRDTWQAWWDGLRAEPGGEERWQERERRFEPRTPGAGVSLGEMTGLLDAAGFAEHEVFHGWFDKRLLVAIR